jgi:hypothetical protein
MIDSQSPRFHTFLSVLFFLIALIPYFFYSFLNLDPLHDGWFSAPAAALADGRVAYRDVVTSYGWFTPTFLAAIIKIFGFELVYFRMMGFLLLIGICVLFVLLLQKSIGLNRSLAVVSVWLLIGLGQMTKDPLALPSWGLWPNQFLIFISLLLIHLLLRARYSTFPVLTLIGLLAGLAPWIRAQGILILASTLFVFTIRIYQSDAPKKPLRIVQLFSVSFLTVSTPFFYLSKNSALNEWYWQTIEMPRTGEWIGMPNPVDWVIQNFGLAIILTFAFLVVSAPLIFLRVSGRKVVFLFAPILILISIFPIAKASPEDSLVVRKANSLLYLYTNFNFYNLPILVILCATLLLLFKIIQNSLATRGRVLVESPTLVAALGLPTLTLVYYNFGHLWGVAPLLIIIILHYWKSRAHSFARILRFRQVIWIYSILVALLAIPQVYLNLVKPTFSYSASGLSGMRGQDSQQVIGVNNAIDSLSSLPKGDLVFFLCEDAFYSTTDGKYISDNLFYSSSMTSFDKRSSRFRVPSAETNFIVYCPGTNTISITEFSGSWVLSDLTSGKSNLQIYERK